MSKDIDEALYLHHVDCGVPPVLETNVDVYRAVSATQRAALTAFLQRSDLTSVTQP
jgi:hypothetical protein